MKSILLNTITIVLIAWVGLFAGAVTGSVIIPKSTGFEGPAILFWYSIYGSGLFIIVGLLLIRKLSQRQRRYLLFILLITTALSASWFITKLSKEQLVSSRTNQSTLIHAANVSFASYSDLTFKETLGLGIAMVSIRKNKSLLFYSNAGLLEDPIQEKVIDSITFNFSDGQTDIATAPPWLFPEYIKMDYNILMFRVTTVTKNRVEVIGNSQTKQRYWINIEDVSFKYWPQFILDINSVKAIDSEKNPVRIKALDNASILSSAGNVPLRPLAIKGEWLLVSTNGLADRIPPHGWIRWKEDNKLTITYSLLE